METNPNHPCFGKDCLKCETCIFDEDIFKEKEPINKNNMCNKNLCNDCVNLVKEFQTYCPHLYNAACRAVNYEAFGRTNPRRIDYSIAANQDVVSPYWCPLKEKNKQLSLPYKPSTTPTQLTYGEKRDMMKGLKRHIEWEDIKEGEIYVIPKILTQCRKIVKVITKNSYSCVCHEISDITGNEFTYNTTIYPSDLDTVFITELRKF